MHAYFMPKIMELAGGLQAETRVLDVGCGNGFTAGEFIKRNCRVVGIEVVEHLYSPRDYARGCFNALKPGGRLICTTPYHGYLKNLVLSMLGKWDAHANPLWDGGHIKLWSRSTLTSLLLEAGFTNIQFQGVGRFPYLWMTMVVSADKPKT